MSVIYQDLYSVRVIYVCYLCPRSVFVFCSPSISVFSPTYVVFPCILFLTDLYIIFHISIYLCFSVFYFASIHILLPIHYIVFPCISSRLHQIHFLFLPFRPALNTRQLDFSIMIFPSVRAPPLASLPPPSLPSSSPCSNLSSLLSSVPDSTPAAGREKDEKKGKVKRGG